ncbi:MAG: urea amidolyase associated protein UAAP1 [Verrucomicrobiota bacterium]
MNGIPPDLVRFTEVLHPGCSWSHVLKRGTSLRIQSHGDGANVSALFYNFEILNERLNIPDTLKCQHTAMLTKGHCLYSDMGRILASITGDTCGWHDPLIGPSTAEGVVAKYGSRTYQMVRNDFHKNGRDCFLTELGKYGLNERDLAMSVNFFSKVTANAEGRLQFCEGHSRAGAYVDLRAELNTLVVLNTCVHPLDPRKDYAPQAVELVVWSSQPPAPDDLCRTSCPENTRGFEITKRYFL